MRKMQTNFQEIIEALERGETIQRMEVGELVPNCPPHVDGEPVYTYEMHGLFGSLHQQSRI